jgi:hypothetical protein
MERIVSHFRIGRMFYKKIYISQSVGKKKIQDDISVKWIKNDHDTNMIHRESWLGSNNESNIKYQQFKEWSLGKKGKIKIRILVTR